MDFKDLHGGLVLLAMPVLIFLQTIRANIVRWEHIGHLSDTRIHHAQAYQQGILLIMLVRLHKPPTEHVTHHKLKTLQELQQEIKLVNAKPDIIVPLQPVSQKEIIVLRLLKDFMYLRMAVQARRNVHMEHTVANKHQRNALHGRNARTYMILP